MLLCSVVYVLLISYFGLGYSMLAVQPSMHLESVDILGELIFNQHPKTGTFRRIHRVSFLQCAVECMLRRHCACISYYRATQRCELHDSCGSEKTEPFSDIVHSNIGTWIKNFTGACSSMQCEDNYMCDIQDGIAFCIISECPEESLFHNATATSELRGVGDVRQYVCSNEVAEKSRRQPYAVCQEGGSWKLSDHSCQIPTGCSDVARSGVYDIRPVHSPTLSVYCDAETDGGGWTVIQRRMDGSVDFFKFWYDYKHGFGDISREFWLGNDILSALTKQGEYELRIDMEAFDGEKRFAHYDHFAVADELTHFTLKVGNFSGDAGDSFGVCDGMKFSTRDLDNDVSSLTHENCADRYKGGWWYGACYHANLNGMYLAGDYFGGDPIGITWLTWKGFHYSLKRTEMKIRRKSVNRAPPSS